MALLPMAKTVLVSLFKKPVTRNYPVKSRELPTIVRGQVVFESENCIYCGICVRKCPTDAISVSKKDKTLTIDQFDCIQCNSCVEMCPKQSLTMLPTLPSVSVSKTSTDA